MQSSLKSNTEEIREVRHILRPLRKVWIKVGLEKLNIHKWGFKMEKVNRPLEVKNVDGTDNNGGRIEYEIECNMYFKGHVKRIRMDVCKLGRMKVILGMSWFVLKKEKVYLLLREEREEVQAFIEDQLRKDYIRYHAGQ